MEHMETLNYDKSGDMWSESDASECMKDQKYVEMDNKILKRLFQASTQVKESEQPEEFKHERQDRMERKDRRSAIA